MSKVHFYSSGSSKSIQILWCSFIHIRRTEKFYHSIKPHFMKTWICKEMASFLWTSASKHPTLLQADRFSLTVMKNNTQATSFYEYWSQWDLRENWYWEERSKALPPFSYRKQISFQQLKREEERKNKGGRGRKKRKKCNVT